MERDGEVGGGMRGGLGGLSPRGNLWLRFLSGPDIDGLGLTSAEIIGAVEGAVLAHGEGRVVVRAARPPGAGRRGRRPLQRAARAPVRRRWHRRGQRGQRPSEVGGLSGIKVVGDFVDNYARGLPSELGLLTLYDPATGIPLSIMDATLITACRTGAMTAVGAKYLARKDARVLGHVGARGTALWNVVFLDELFDLDEIRVTSRRPESREAFARQLAGLTARRSGSRASRDETFDGADILVEASRLTQPQPLLRTSAVRPGAFVVPYGTISAVELDLLDVMDKVVVDDWREAQSGRFGALRPHVDTGRLSPRRPCTPNSARSWPGSVRAASTPTSGSCSGTGGCPSWTSPSGELILRRAQEAEAGTMLRYR